MPVDFGEAYVIKGTNRKKIHFFAAKKLSWFWKRKICKVDPLQKREFFFDGLFSAFGFFRCSKFPLNRHTFGKIIILPKKQKPLRTLFPRGLSSGGDEGSRTPDLVNAIHALSQLSYIPTPGADDRTRTGDPILTMDVLYLLSYIGKINGGADGIRTRGLRRDRPAR